MPMSTRQLHRGYTLIEVGIFSIVMLVATAAFLTLIELDRRARATNDVVTNLSYVVDSMARSVRTGTLYDCSTAGGATDCAGGANSFNFRDSDGRTVSYEMLGSSVRQCVSDICMVLTDPRVTVDALAFYVYGTATLAQGNVEQPTVTFIVQGYVRPSPSADPIEFTIESSATQRLIDL
jgi:type II secretory pathway pseudopilin PulG